MATAKTDNGQLPSGYVSPFKRVQMEERIDDGLACVAILTNKPLEQIKELAYQLGFPKHGPAWVDEALIAKLLFQHGLVSSPWKEVASAAAMPYIAILMVDYNPATEIGRNVIWHHVKGTDTQQAFSYIIDPAHWLDPKHHVTTAFGHLAMKPPMYYLEVTPRPDGSKKAK